MLTIKKLIALLVPTVILGFSCFWYRRKGQISKRINNIKEKHNENVACDDCAEDNISAANKDITDSNMGVNTNDGENSDVIENNLSPQISSEKVITQHLIGDVHVQNSESEVVNGSLEILKGNEMSSTETNEIFVPYQSSEDIFCAEKYINLPLNSHNDDIEKSSVCNDALSKTNGKRVRNQSSCDGDSAFVDDYSSDNNSVNGSDCVLKTPELIIEEQILTSTVETLEANISDGHDDSYEEWHHPLLDCIDLEHTTKVMNWGSVPTSDIEDDTLELSLGVDYSSEQLIGEISKKVTDEFEGKSVDKLQASKENKSKRKKSGFKKKSQRKASSPRTPEKENRSPAKPNKTTRKGKSYRKEVEESWRSPEIKEDKQRKEESKRRSPEIKEDKQQKEESKSRILREYEFPDEMCGRLIGKAGKYINVIRQKTGADICVEPERRGQNRVVSVSGLPHQIERTDKLLNNKFEDNFKRIEDPEINTAIANLKCASLPDGVHTDVIVTAIVDAGNFFVQIFHPNVDQILMSLQTDLADCYFTSRKKYEYTEHDLPAVGDYCVSFIDNVWCRLKVKELLPENEVMVCFVDYGGNVNVPVEVLRKIR